MGRLNEPNITCRQVLVEGVCVEGVGVGELVCGKWEARR